MLVTLCVALLAAPLAKAQVLGSPDGMASAAEARATAGPFFLPLRGPLESPFGYRWGRLHAGVDIGALQADRVHAALAGVVTKVGYQRYYEGYGKIVELRHGEGLVTLYAHLASYGVRPGEWVGRGELLGRAGCTGSCTGQHLHFEVRIQGRPVNPMRFLRGMLR